LTLLFDVPLDVARARLDNTRTLDKFEREKHDFFEKVRNAYLQRAAQFPHRIRVVDSTQPLANVNQQLEQLIDQLDELFSLSLAVKRLAALATNARTHAARHIDSRSEWDR
jgi:thymidylate kinase